MTFFDKSFQEWLALQGVTCTCKGGPLRGRFGVTIHKDGCPMQTAYTLKQRWREQGTAIHSRLKKVFPGSWLEPTTTDYDPETQIHYSVYNSPRH